MTISEYQKRSAQRHAGEAHVGLHPRTRDDIFYLLMRVTVESQ